MFRCVTYAEHNCLNDRDQEDGTHISQVDDLKAGSRGVFYPITRWEYWTPSYRAKPPLFRIGLAKDQYSSRCVEATHQHSSNLAGIIYF